MKKLLALLITVALVFAFTVPVFAGNGKGSDNSQTVKANKALEQTIENWEALDGTNLVIRSKTNNKDGSITYQVTGHVVVHPDKITLVQKIQLSIAAGIVRAAGFDWLE